MLLNIFVEAMIFFQDSLKNRKFKSTTFILNIIFCNYVRVFTTNFNQLYAYLLTTRY